MNIKKRIFIIVIIFAILQCFELAFTHSVHAEGSIFDNVFKAGDAYSEMGSNQAGEIENYANSVFQGADATFDILKVIGTTLFIAAFAVTVIGLNIGSIQDKARVKMVLGVSMGLALLFIYAEKILEFFTSIFESF